MDREAMIAALIFGGSGSGGGLPAVTSADNGKSLKVVSGAWAAADEAKLFVVTITQVGGNLIADKTPDEIIAALNAGNTPIAKVGDNYYPLARIDTTPPKNVWFCSQPYNGRSNYVYNVSAFGATSLTTYAIAPAPLVVNYTITGQSGNVYTLSADATLAQILAAKAAGREIKAVLTTIEGTAELPLTTSGLTFVGFSMVAPYEMAYNVFEVMHYTNDDVETVEGRIVPISTAQMSYDSGTGTLAITE